MSTTSTCVGRDMKNGLRKLTPLGGLAACLWRPQPCGVLFYIEQPWISPSHCFLHLFLLVHGWSGLSVLLCQKQCCLCSLLHLSTVPLLSTHQIIPLASHHDLNNNKIDKSYQQKRCYGTKPRVAGCKLSWIWETSRRWGRPDAAMDMNAASAWLDGISHRVMGNTDSFRMRKSNQYRFWRSNFSIITYDMFWLELWQPWKREKQKNRMHIFCPHEVVS